jgi:hypothetical protein
MSDAFMRQTAKHFLALTFHATLPDKSHVVEVRSGFVIETCDLWLLITAGHVVETIRDYAKQGIAATHFVLRDDWVSGGAVPFGVPFAFEPERCLALNHLGADYAAWVLDPMTIRALGSGGVQPIGEEAWGLDARLAKYEVLLLVGVPSETVSVHGSTLIIKPTLMPITLVDASKSGLDVVDPAVCVARLEQSSDPDQHLVKDVDGMSGAPIYGLKTIEGKLRYFVAGIQSGWYRSARHVTFFPARGFFEAVERVVKEAIATIPGGAEVLRAERDAAKNVVRE